MLSSRFRMRSPSAGSREERGVNREIQCLDGLFCHVERHNTAALTAMAGVVIRRSSSMESVLSLAVLSGTTAMESFSSKPLAGMRIRRAGDVEERMRNGDGRRHVAGRAKNAGWSMTRTTQKMMSMTAVPMMLKLRWTTAARFAFVFAPMDESIAVTHVPMFWPMMIEMAEAMVIAPVLAKACKTPTEADGDWMIAVNTAPANTPKQRVRGTKAGDCGSSRSSEAGNPAPLIASMPYIRTAKAK